jgi:deoxyribodipyrimidine photolyase-related protein
VVVVEPGEWRVREQLRRAVPGLEIRPDRHFLCSHEDFAAHTAGRKQLRMEFFYREIRRKHGVLMNSDQPVGGTWNYDTENRGAFGPAGPGQVPVPRAFQPDAVTRDVIELVEKKFADHPGSLKKFDWPVTHTQAHQALEDFIANRLPEFGRFEDAMWTGEPVLYHSRLSAAMNLKLLDPREVVAAALKAYERGRAPLPAFYWTGDTEMKCLREVIGQTLEYGFAHHIQRLMVTGLYALLLGVDPVEVHKWYLAVYVDAVEWVELPNVLGMSQYADGGIMASKPYVATGKCIQRMSKYCAGCRFKPGQATGPDACPFTPLYWVFLLRHQKLLRKNTRMMLQLKNLDRLDAATRSQIRRQADVIRAAPAGATGSRRSE